MFSIIQVLIFIINVWFNTLEPNFKGFLKIFKGILKILKDTQTFKAY